MEYTYVIVDSNSHFNRQLEHFLGEYGRFACVSEATTVKEGSNAILKHTPDIVFMHLNEQSTELFQMVRELHQYLEVIPLLIGISKGTEKAYDALKNDFFDYWVIPFDEFDIRKSLLRLKKKIPKPQEPDTLTLKTYQDFRYLDTKDILYLKSDNNNTEFILKDGSVINTYKTLKTYEGSLPQSFVRIHQSYIVNTQYISGISFGKATCMLKVRNLELPFSKSYRPNVNHLQEILSKNTISCLN